LANTVSVEGLNIRGVRRRSPHRCTPSWACEQNCLARGKQAVAPEDLDVWRLGDEVWLMWDDDAHEPVAIRECRQCTRAKLVVRKRR
jgi:hypothetical protein